MTDGNEESFESYLHNVAKKRGGGSLSTSSIQNYLTRLQTLSAKLREEKLIQYSLFEIDDMKELIALHDMLLHGNTKIALENKRQDNVLSAALSHYITMLSLQPEDDNFEEILRPMEAYKDGAIDLTPRTNKDLAKLFKESIKKPNTKQAITILQTKRDRAQAVRAITLDRANDHCDLCGKTTFLLPNGHYFLECHHLVFLANNGLDSIINTVALCPNCHRMMHLGLKKEQDDSYEDLLELVYHYLENEKGYDETLPDQFINYFQQDHPEVASFR